VPGSCAKGRGSKNNTSARDKFGLLIELTAGYPAPYGTVPQTDVVCERCHALFAAYHGITRERAARILDALEPLTEPPA
jgi:hypothetical protein